MIVRFKNFLNENVQIRTFDLVIDENGNIIYDGSIPIKGNLDLKKRLIIGSDSNNYIAAIDRTGSLYSFLETDKSSNILLDGSRIPVPNELKTRRQFWNKSENYSNILPILPTGWVNVKIDMELIKRIRRYSKGITNRKGIVGLKERLVILSRNDIQLRNRSTDTIQKEMSAIMMLHHLNELKGHFDPSSAGFLFESYIAGLITGSRVKEDNSPIDIEDSLGDSYQVKLLNFGNISSGITKLDGEYLDHYVISFKFADKIKVFILSGKDVNSKNYIENFKVRGDAYNFSFPKFRTFVDTTNDFIYDIPLLDINKKIEKIAEGLKNVLDVLYRNLSGFQFNIETILTGVDEEGSLINENDFNRIENNSKVQLTTMKKELDSLICIIKK